MAFVSVPKDLTKVKNKIILNLTKRQLICLGIAAAVGLPFYFLARGLIGSSNAATGMCLLMLPAFLFAMYEKDGLPLENMEQYMDAFKYGMPPHGGLGIGMERLTMQLLGEENVREACLFPRDLNRLEP